MPNIHDNEYFLISGATSIASGQLGTKGYNLMNFSYHGSTTGNIAASGDLALQGRIIDDSSSPFITFFSTQLRGSSGNYYSSNGVTWNSVRALLTNYSGGSITVAARIQS